MACPADDPRDHIQNAHPPDSRNGGRHKAKQRFYSRRHYEALLLTPALTGLRFGEFLALCRCDFAEGMLNFRYSAHNGRLVESGEQKNPERSVPVPASLVTLLEAVLAKQEEEPGGSDSERRADISGASAISSATMISIYTHPLQGSHDAIR